MVLLVVIRRTYPKEFVSIFDVGYFRDIDSNFFVLNLLVTIGFCFLLPIVLLKSFAKVSVSLSTNYLLSDYFIVSIALFLFILARYGIVYSYFYSNQNLDHINSYIKLKFFFRAWQFIITLVIGFLFFFSPISGLILFYILVSTIGFFFILEDIFLFVESFKQDEEGEKIASAFHIILYLCALEILPQLIVVKSLIDL